MYNTPVLEQYAPGSPYYPNGMSASGVDVATMNWINGFDIMGLSHLRDLSTTWISTSTYNSLFTKMALPNQPDPIVLWVNGIIAKDGSFTFSTPWYRYDSGYVDNVPSGNYIIQFLASDGSTLSTKSFDARFEMNIDPYFSAGQDIQFTTVETVPIDFAPFAFAVEIPPNTRALKSVVSN